MDPCKLGWVQEEGGFLPVLSQVKLHQRQWLTSFGATMAVANVQANTHAKSTSYYAQSFVTVRPVRTSEIPTAW
jgi:hypothetical protein